MKHFAVKNSINADTFVLFNLFIHDLEKLEMLGSLCAIKLIFTHEEPPRATAH